MIYRKLALSLILLTLVSIGGTVGLATWREARALAANPPTGQFVTVNGLRVHYEVKGTGPDLVLIHGASGNLRDFTFALRDPLAEHFRVIALDRPGFGHSDAIPDVSLAAQARHLSQAAAQLGATKPMVLGQSYGGSVGMAWALQGNVAALVTVGSPSLPWPGGLSNTYRVSANPIGATLLAAFVPKSYVDATIASIFAPAPEPAGFGDYIGSALTLRRVTLRTNGAQVLALRAQLDAMQSDYPNLTIPIELIHGDADTTVPLTIHSAPLSKILPNATLTVLPGAGHMPHHTHVDVIVAATLRAAGLR